MTHSDREKEIEARLKAATPGPWARDPFDGPSYQVIASGNRVVSYHHRHERQKNDFIVPDHELMAHAPSDLSYLLEENRRLRGALEVVTETLADESPCVNEVGTPVHDALTLARAALNRSNP